MSLEILKDAVKVLQELTAIRQSLEDHALARERIEGKLDTILERLVRLETRYEHLRAEVRNEILADIKADLVKAQVYLDLQAQGLLPPRRGEKPEGK
ncbi:MAG: hypothetical protein HYY24_12325 [Verrucomicrobia bacterium]|nr:hypothetical protein [Verrucomicrobiota bacterium]